MNILLTICGRAGSKGLKNKNLKMFLGYPLSFYTVSAIDLYKKANPNINCDVVLNTDSEALIQQIESAIDQKIHFIRRSEVLSHDNTPKIDVIKNCYEVMSERRQVVYDMVVDLDITSPLRRMSDIAHLIEKKRLTDSDVVFSVTEPRRNPYFNMVTKTESGYVRVIKSNFNSRQEAPELFDMNASLYAYEPSFLLKGLGIFDGKCEVIHMKDTAVLDIDSEADFEIMCVIANHLFKTENEFAEVQSHIVNILKK